MPRYSCSNCFAKRKNEASRTHEEEILATNYGLYFIPFVGLGALAVKGLKHVVYTDGWIYHVYSNGYHEKWSKHSSSGSNMKKCDDCYQYETDYYTLESRENN